jgi:CheY-like chemotaxis protein
MPTMPPKILLVSPQARHLDAWSQLLELEPEVQVVPVAGEADAAEPVLDAQAPDLALVELSASLPLARVEAWAAAHPRTDFLAVSAETGPEVLLRAMRAGVREILPAPRQGQGLGEEGDRVGRGHGLGQSMAVFARRVGLQGSLLGRAREIKHVAAGGFDEQRFLGAEVIGDLARKGVRSGRDVGDRGAGEPTLLEQAACGIKQQRAHLAPRRPRRAHRVLRIGRRHAAGGLRTPDAGGTAIAR